MPRAWRREGGLADVRVSRTVWVIGDVLADFTCASLHNSCVYSISLGAFQIHHLCQLNICKQCTQRFASELREREDDFVFTSVFSF